LAHPASPCLLDRIRLSTVGAIILTQSAFAMILQAVIGLGLLNVWLLRARSPTRYRGGSARTLKEEFTAYGLPDALFYLVGALKIGAGVVLLAGLAIPLPVELAAGTVAGLMVGSIIMHVKVKDPAMKSVPAVIMLVSCLSFILLH
jgi:hypothetical protein